MPRHYERLFDFATVGRYPNSSSRTVAAESSPSESSAGGASSDGRSQIAKPSASSTGWPSASSTGTCWPGHQTSGSGSASFVKFGAPPMAKAKPVVCGNGVGAEVGGTVVVVGGGGVGGARHVAPERVQPLGHVAVATQVVPERVKPAAAQVKVAGAEQVIVPETTAKAPAVKEV